ncbi:MAG: hypothetical protein KAV99_05035, partial [Candidatus Latescibacteria bacterium]|nr:hypothetical protein [Candidatus Latescibacterota bacterium]
MRYVLNRLTFISASLLILFSPLRAGTEQCSVPTQWIQGIGPKGGIVNRVVIAPWNCDTLVAATFDGLLLSADGGKRWERFGEGLEGHHLRVLTADTTDIGTLYAGTYTGGTFRSTDRGKTWTPVGDSLTGSDIRAVLIDPQDHR